MFIPKIGFAISEAVCMAHQVPMARVDESIHALPLILTRVSQYAVSHVHVQHIQTICVCVYK